MRPLLRFVLLRYLPGRPQNSRRPWDYPALPDDVARYSRRRQSDGQVRRQDAGRGGKIYPRSRRLVEGAWRGGSYGRVTISAAIARSLDRAPTESATGPV